MTLLDRYLGAVAALLPRAQREDIVAELRDILLNQIEAEEGRLGRPLDKLEIEVVLRRFGHPLAVAGRYGPQRVLIGVELYPFYIFALKVALAIAAFVTVILTAVQVAAGGDNPSDAVIGALRVFPPLLLIRVLNDLVPTVLMLVGAATLIGAAIERGWIKTEAFQQWRVADLPHVSDLSMQKGPFQSKRFEALLELTVTVLFILWLVGMIRFPGQADFDTLRVVWNPILATLRLPVLLLSVGQALSSLMVILRPGWVRGRAAAEIALSVAGLVLVAVLWRAGPLATFQAGPVATAEDAANLRMTIDQICRVSLPILAVVLGGKLLVDGWRLARGP
ncbi:MAG: hypothetical protein JWP92_1057, partial [Caulobacter sp.]|nr:hypothetical protein [Caulobacter sp.]